MPVPEYLIESLHSYLSQRRQAYNDNPEAPLLPYELPPKADFKASELGRKSGWEDNEHLYREFLLICKRLIAIFEDVGCEAMSQLMVKIFYDVELRRNEWVIEELALRIEQMWMAMIQGLIDVEFYTTSADNLDTVAEEEDLEQKKYGFTFGFSGDTQTLEQVIGIFPPTTLVEMNLDTEVWRRYCAHLVALAWVGSEVLEDPDRFGFGEDREKWKVNDGPDALLHIKNEAKKAFLRILETGLLDGDFKTSEKEEN